MRQYIALLVSTSMFGMPVHANAQDIKKVSEQKVVSPSGDESEYDVSTQQPKPVAKAASSSYQFTTDAKKEEAPDPNAENYPYGALRAAYLSHVREVKQAEELEKRKILSRDEYEKLKALSQTKIDDYKRKIQDLKNQSIVSKEEMDIMDREISDLKAQQSNVNSMLAEVESRSKIEMGAHEKMKTELNASKTKLNFAIQNLEITRKNTADKVNQAQIDMERMRAQIMTNESIISRAQNDTVRAQTEELNVRNEWATLNEKYKVVAQEKARVQDELADARKQLALARNDYSKVKEETEKTDYELRKSQEKLAYEKSLALSEMKRIEELTANAHNQRARNEAEKVRLQAEIGRLKEETSAVKLRHEQAVAKMNESNALVLESRLNFEKSRADLAGELASESKARYDYDSRQLQIRNLASAMESSGVEELKPGTIGSSDCVVRRSPAADGEVIRYLKANSKVLTGPAEGNWYKILNSKGKVQYIERSCVTVEGQ